MNLEVRTMEKGKGPAETRERVLDIAEGLFAERGIDAVSIRDITGAADVNLAAINYHFGTKEKLIEAVVERRFVTVSDERLRALDAVEKTAGDKPLRLEAVLEAIFRPEIDLAMNRSGGGARFAKLLARCFVEPHPAAEKVIHRDIERLAGRFDVALRRAMPKLSSEEVFWRMHLLMGALHHSLLLLDRKLPLGLSFRADAETYLERFVAFAAAGFRAALPPMAMEGAIKS